MSDERISFIELVDIIVKPRAKPVAAPRPERTQPYEDFVSDDDEVLHDTAPDMMASRPPMRQMKSLWKTPASITPWWAVSQPANI